MIESPERRADGEEASGVHPAELAAGDVEDLAVDVVGERRAEEEHRAGGLLGLRPAGRAGSSSPSHRPHLLGDAELDLLAALAGRLHLSPFSFAWVRRVSTKPKATALTLILN